MNQITINLLILPTRSRGSGYVSKGTKLWAIQKFNPKPIEPNSNTYQIVVSLDRLRNVELILKSYSIEYYKSGV